jgi:SAM-dependent methyltransferase
MADSDAELERIRDAYRERDAGAAAGLTPYAWSNPGYVFYMQELERELLSALDGAGAAVAGGRVLDVGCGSAYFLHRLVEYGMAEGHGIELMPNRVEQARERYPRLDVRQGSATEIPHPDGSFDLVTHFTCLSSVLDPEVRRSIAAEMWRVTAPGGHVLSFDMRPTPAPVAVARRALGAAGALVRGRRAAPSGVTPTVGLSVEELHSLFPAPPVWERAVCLHFDLAGLAARRSLALARALAAMPLLRSHLLVVVRKPG